MKGGVALRSVLLKLGLLAVRMNQSSAEMQIGPSAVLWAPPGTAYRGPCLRHSAGRLQGVQDTGQGDVLSKEKVRSEGTRCSGQDRSCRKDKDPEIL